MARYRGYNAGGYCSGTNSNRTVNNSPSRGNMLTVVRGYGTVNCTGVLPAGQQQPDVVSEVEFTLNVYRNNRIYEGEIYIVNYTTKMKVNSNNLIYFDQSSEMEVICIFEVESGNGSCSYELIVSASPSNCTMNCNGKLYAYVPAIYNTGLNIGGNLETGQIDLYDTGVNTFAIRGCTNVECDCSDSTSFDSYYNNNMDY